MKGLTSTLATIWRLAIPYFRSEDRVAGRVLLAALIAIELLLVAINVLLNQWNNTFYNSLQERNWDLFVHQLLVFCALAAAYIVLAVYQIYLQQWLQIRWRQWMTKNYLGEWLDHANHYRMQLLGDAADNPDQRISEDINLYIEKFLYLGLGLLNSVVTLGSFVVILWVLSASAPFTLFGIDWSIPGYLVWAALIYSIAGTAITQWIGRALINLNFMQQRYEADFRFGLVRVRENAEQIALLNGEPAETHRLLQRFARLAGNWMLMMKRTKWLTFFTAGFSQVSTVFPYAVVSPAYFAGTIQLGGLMQTASAFASVQGALSFFASSTVYRQFAEWRAVVQRLAGFELAVAAGRAAAVTPPVSRSRRAPHGGDRTRRSVGSAADWRAAGRRGPDRGRRRRPRAGDRAVGLRQVDAVPCHRRHLAVRQGPRRAAQGRASHDAAAAPLLPDRHARRRGSLSGRARHRDARDARRGDRRSRPSGAGLAARRGGALEPHAVARRAAAARHRARAAACAGLPVPRRGDRLARRAGRGRALPAAP